MEIIATTAGGVLISATTDEVKAILHSVTGEESRELRIGQKIPAIDYASSITKLKSLHSDYKYTNLKACLEKFTYSFVSLENAIENAANISIE